MMEGKNQQVVTTFYCRKIPFSHRRVAQQMEERPIFQCEACEEAIEGIRAMTILFLEN